MTDEESENSPDSRTVKRNLSDYRLDFLLPNTLYLANIRTDFKRRKSNDYDNDKKSHCLDPLSNKSDSSNNEDGCNNKDESFEKLDPKNLKFSDDFESTNLLYFYKDDTYFKSHLCFIGMEYFCLKYDLSCDVNSDLSCTLRDNPSYKSYVISNIFTKKSPDIQLDEDAIFDASWEVESVHLCKRMIQYSLSSSKSFFNPSDGSTKVYSDVDKDSTQSEVKDDDKEPNNEKDNDIRVIDAFSGIGGNFVHFASNFRYSLGVELNPKRVDICHNNLSVYGVKDSYTILNDSFFNFAEEYLKDPKAYFKDKLKKPELWRDSDRQFDWAFLSPPWGGSGYKGSSSDEVFSLVEQFPEFYRCVELSSKISTNVTLFVPRCQSLFEVVKSASLNNFKYILIDSYLMLPKYHKVRCCMVHLCNNVNMFFNNLNIKNIKKVNFRDFGKLSPTFSTLETDRPTSKTSKTSRKNRKKTKSDFKDNKEESNELYDQNWRSNLESCSVSLDDQLLLYDVKYHLEDYNYLNILITSFLIVLDEYSSFVFRKFVVLVNKLPINTIMNLINYSIQIYNSKGLINNLGNYRTLGGIFFYLLKMNYNNLYKLVEKSLKK